MKCEGCGAEDQTVESVRVSTGRDYPGVGGGMRPPEQAALCADCREPPEPVDVECAACGETIEEHHPNDPPLHTDCSWGAVDE